MKQFKTLVALVLALMLTLTLVGSAMAENGTITITPPTGLDADAENSYPIYKVFDAIYSDAGISYTVMSGKTGVPDVGAQIGASYDATKDNHFIVDAAGNVHYGTQAADGTITDAAEGTSLSEAAIKAIAAYVNGDSPVATATSTGSNNATASIPQDGYYYISTTTGTAVTITSFRPNAAVEDKNSVPGLNKKITGATSIDEDGKKALAQVGTDVTYTAEITVGKGAKGYVFHDTMEAGLTYKNDVKIMIGETEIPATKDGKTNWTAGTATGETFTVDFNDDYIKTLAEGTVIKVIYSATVNDNAITIDPLNNTAYVHYGDRNSNNKTPNSEANVYEAKFTVTKKDGENKPLAGAGFVIKNKDNKYYKLTTTTTGEGADAVTTNVVSWVDNIGDATEYTSNASGEVTSFTGLANGTYTLVESTVPAGYNKAADQNFTIAEHDYTAANLEQTAEVINNAGQELPSTGGIGTTIFYIAGAVLVLGAAAIVIARRKAEQR